MEELTKIQEKVDDITSRLKGIDGNSISILIGEVLELSKQVSALINVVREVKYQSEMIDAVVGRML